MSNAMEWSWSWSKDERLKALEQKHAEYVEQTNTILHDLAVRVTDLQKDFKRIEFELENSGALERL